MIQLIQGNYGHKININIKNNKGNLIQLDDCSVVIDMVYPGNINKRYDLTILDSLNGRVQLKILPEMLNVKNTTMAYKVMGYVDIISPTSQITLEEPICFYIKPNDGRA